jgi:hypothetical protein
VTSTVFSLVIGTTVVSFRVEVEKFRVEAYHLPASPLLDRTLVMFKHRSLFIYFVVEQVLTFVKYLSHRNQSVPLLWYLIPVLLIRKVHLKALVNITRVLITSTFPCITDNFQCLSFAGSTITEHGYKLCKYKSNSIS